MTEVNFDLKSCRRPDRFTPSFFEVASELAAAFASDKPPTSLGRHVVRQPDERNAAKVIGSTLRTVPNCLDADERLTWSRIVSRLERADRGGFVRLCVEEIDRVCSFDAGEFWKCEHSVRSVVALAWALFPLSAKTDQEFTEKLGNYILKASTVWNWKIISDWMNTNQFESSHSFLEYANSIIFNISDFFDPNDSVLEQCG